MADKNAIRAIALPAISSGTLYHNHGNETL